MQGISGDKKERIRELKLTAEHGHYLAYWLASVLRLLSEQFLERFHYGDAVRAPASSRFPSALLQQLGYQSGPSGLVGGPQAGAGIRVEVFVEE
jgi:hypothetical protein